MIILCSVIIITFLFTFISELIYIDEKEKIYCDYDYKYEYYE